jgi:hypothetical protein
MRRAVVLVAWLSGIRKIQTPIQKVESGKYYCIQEKEITDLHSRGSPFIMHACHFYIPKLPSDIRDIPLTFRIKMSKVVTPSV